MRRTPRSSSPAAAPDGDPDGPEEILEFADQAVDYVRRSLGVTLEYDSDTLPVLDHYLRAVPAEVSKVAAAELVAATAGAYFGEVVRRRLGGSWVVPSSHPGTWRLILPTGLWFFPAAMALAAIRGPEEEVPGARRADPDRDPDDDDRHADPADEDAVADWDTSLQAPPTLKPHVSRVLHGMADVSEDEFYSLCNRFDTLEHVQSVLAAIAQPN